MKDLLWIPVFCLWLARAAYSATFDILSVNSNVALFLSICAAIFFNFLIFRNLKKISDLAQHHPYAVIMTITAFFVIPLLFYKSLSSHQSHNENFMDVLILACLSAIVFNYVANNFFARKNRGIENIQ